MSRTAPAVNGTPQFKKVSMRWIDYSGDKRSDSLQFPATGTDAQIEAYAAALGAASNASLYAIVPEFWYNSTPDKSNAVNEPKDSVFDNMVMLAKTSANLSQRGFIPAPINDLFADTTDQPNPASAELIAVMTAFLALVGAGYSIVSLRYTERREINEAVNV